MSKTRNPIAVQEANVAALRALLPTSALAEVSVRAGRGGYVVTAFGLEHESGRYARIEAWVLGFALAWSVLELRRAGELAGRAAGEAVAASLERGDGIGVV